MEPSTNSTERRGGGLDADAIWHADDLGMLPVIVAILPVGALAGAE